MHHRTERRRQDHMIGQLAYEIAPDAGRIHFDGLTSPPSDYPPQQLGLPARSRSPRCSSISAPRQRGAGAAHAG
jgi:hypothetical protein